MKKLPTPAARALLAKLEALAERGINGEKDAAKLKLKRLKSRYDFTKANDGGTDIFKGVFVSSFEAAPVLRFGQEDYDIANAVKWAIESATGIRCGFRDGGQLIAAATADTACRLSKIAATVASDFSTLWREFKAAPTVNEADRAVFVRGLYDGMMDEVVSNQALPTRAKVDKVKRAKKKAVAIPAGLSIHPYSVAVDLGRRVRFAAPLDEISGALTEAVKGQLPEGK